MHGKENGGKEGSGAETPDSKGIMLMRLEPRSASHPDRPRPWVGTHRAEGSGPLRDGVGVILARRGSLACGKRPISERTLSSTRQGLVPGPSPHAPEQRSLPAERRKPSAAAQPQGCPRPPACLWDPGHQSFPSSGGQSAWRRGPLPGAGKDKGLITEKGSFPGTSSVPPAAPHKLPFPSAPGGCSQKTAVSWSRGL